MNEYPKRYELRTRSSSPRSSGNQTTGNKETGGGFFRTGLCMMLLAFVVFLKLSGGEEGRDMLSALDKLINSQLDIGRTAEVMSEFVYDAAGYFSPEDEDISLALPVSGGKISEGFVETVHPVFGTNIAPTGITFSASPSSYVFSSASGSVSSVTENTDGTKRVVIRCAKDMSFSCDNLMSVYVKAEDDVKRGDIIGILPESDPAYMKYEVWVDNVAADPSEYLESGIAGDEEK